MTRHVFVDGLSRSRLEAVFALRPVQRRFPLALCSPI